MEFLDGAPLQEHFNSKKEKRETFSEESIWNIFVQVSCIYMGENSRGVTYARSSKIVLALRYIHKEKRIVHRDLTPGNIMLGENDRVTISEPCVRLREFLLIELGRLADFGLAKQKPPDTSVLTSVVGTILYHWFVSYVLVRLDESVCVCSPELIQGMPYGEKADIWAAGCILYQMATLEPPFTSHNVLSLATKAIFFYCIHHAIE